MFRFLDSTLAELIQDLSYTPEEKQFLELLKNKMIGIIAQKQMKELILQSLLKVEDQTRITPSFLREILHLIKIEDNFLTDKAISEILKEGKNN